MYAHLIEYVRKSCVQTAHSVSCCTAVQLLQFTLSRVNTLVERWQAARASWTTLWWSRDNSRSTSLLLWRQKMQQLRVYKSLSCYVLYCMCDCPYVHVVVREQVCLRVCLHLHGCLFMCLLSSPLVSPPLLPSPSISPLPLSPSLSPPPLSPPPLSPPPLYPPPLYPPPTLPLPLSPSPPPGLSSGGLDYLIEATELLFLPNIAHSVATTTIYDDKILEGTETYNLTLRVSQSPTTVLVSEPSEALIHIEDNDGKLLSIHTLIRACMCACVPHAT